MALSNWDKKAQATFDKIMEVVPEPMREAMKPQLITMIENKAAGSPVTVEVIEKLVREDMPEPQKSVIMGALGLSEAAPEAKAPEPAQELSWEGESEQMVEKILGVIPEMLRGAVKPKLLDFINTKAGPHGVVTESLVVDAIQEMNPPEPYKSQIMKVLAVGAGIDLSKVDDILSKYQRKQEELVSVFHELQKEYGYLPKEALDKVSEYLNVPLSRAYRVATSYQAFTLEPKEKHTVKVCDGIACHLKHSDKLYEELKGTSDGRFTIEKIRCLGCCGPVPMVMVDDEWGDGNWAKGKIAKF
jgi:NADH-quinone oxidoreductase subunit E